LKNDGTRPEIIINVDSYDGFIQNGQEVIAGQDNIYVYNLFVNGDSRSPQIGAGWLCKKGFANAADNNYIVNCSSIGDLPGGTVGSGGIVGAFAAKDGGRLYINGCSSSGDIGENDGGIVGASAGDNGGTVICKECYTTGIIGSFGGGIFGRYAGNDGGYAEANKCYTTGVINGDSGGIFGEFAGNNGEAIAEKCYSRGNIAIDGGGIYGRGAGSDSGTTAAINCYSNGVIGTPGDGIYGVGKVNGVETNCYVAEGTWNNVTANAALVGIPNPVVGTTWISRGINQPYELSQMGYTPYQTLVIDASSNLIKIYGQSIQAGQNSNSAVIFDASGSGFEILQFSGGNASSYGTITMNSTSGVISTTSQTAGGVYTIFIRNVGSYHTTQFILSVTSPSIPIKKVYLRGLLNFNQINFRVNSARYSQHTSYSVHNWFKRIQ
jgi:hypothetical protein